MTLVHLCAEKLQTGARIVLETINPNCPQAMSWFYLDPSHVRPVPAELLRFVLEQNLFQVEKVTFSAPLPGCDKPAVLDVSSGLPADAMFYQDYAAIAIKL
jgi:O-antigen chain-terminating methyltransferase